MIGGTDIRVPMNPGPGVDDLRFVLSFFANVWRNALVEDIGSSDETEKPIRALSPAHHFHEALIYRDRKSLNSWQRFGATTRNGGTLVHILVGEHELTFVVDSKRSKLGILVREMIDSLRYNRQSAGLVSPEAVAA